MANELCLYITGLPGAGKSTIGKYVSENLSIPLLDKDDFLESLFETRGVGDANCRQQLSREADVQFINEAKARSRVVLVSHWRPNKLQVDYGTPCDWIIDTFDSVVEIYCACAVEIAAKRFVSRDRHPGHVDKSMSFAEINGWLKKYAAYLPIDAGRSFKINSENDKWKNTIDNAIQKNS